MALRSQPDGQTGGYHATGHRQNGEDATLEPFRPSHGLGGLHRLPASRGAITPTSLQSQKITVYGVGKTLRKHDVPGQYIQPLRQNNNGTPVTRLQQRVIVLGADLTGDRTAVGSYAQMRPDIKHPHGDDVVAVMLEGGAGPFFFHILRLSRATNHALQTMARVFPATTF
ncbi:hypothetical protein B0H17DRAFT_1202380 [Mycena rosella]|uniref:Uncharacterized protein n=1 Tax=Mycena rosella TaxID=1033263 RepID=A0AAD7DDQ1_MYCRO|nr:hypothetical protein B0H17DRAFT_1202380 [Mycena rosella]